MPSSTTLGPFSAVAGTTSCRWGELMTTRADRSRQIVEHEGEAYVLLPRSMPSSYDIVRLKDQCEVGAVWLRAGPHEATCVCQAARRGISRADLREIVVAGIRGGLFA